MKTSRADKKLLPVRRKGFFLVECITMIIILVVLLILAWLWLEICKSC